MKRVMIGLLFGFFGATASAALPELPLKIFGKKAILTGSCQLGERKKEFYVEMSRPYEKKYDDIYFSDEAGNGIPFNVYAGISLERETFALQFRRTGPGLEPSTCYSPEACVTKPLVNGESVNLLIEDVKLNAGDAGRKLACNAQVKVETLPVPATSVLPMDLTFKPIRLEGADAEVLFTVLSQGGDFQYPVSTDPQPDIVRVSGYITCFAGACRVGMKHLLDSSGYYNGFFAQIGIPELSQVSIEPQIVALPGERQFNAVCRFEKRPGYNNGVKQVRECTVGQNYGAYNRWHRRLFPDESARVVSLLPEAKQITASGKVFIDTSVHCQFVYNEPQYCEYNKKAFTEEGASSWKEKLPLGDVKYFASLIQDMPGQESEFGQVKDVYVRFVCDKTSATPQCSLMP